MLGYEGNTGYTEPPGFYHLHFETRHGATTFSCGKDGTAVDPYAASTWMWEDQPRGGQPPNHADFAPAVASYLSSRVDIFVRGANNDLYQKTWNGSGWSNWTRPHPGNCLKSAPASTTARESLGGCTMLAPAVASWGSGRLDVFYRGCEFGPSGAGVFHRSWNGSSWSPEANRGGCLASGPGTDAWAPEWLVAHYRGCDSPGRMYKLTWNGSAWAEALFSSWP